VGFTHRLPALTQSWRGTDYLLVLVVIVIGAARLIVRLIKIPARP